MFISERWFTSQRTTQNYIPDDRTPQCAWFCLQTVVAHFLPLSFRTFVIKITSLFCVATPEIVLTTCRNGRMNKIQLLIALLKSKLVVTCQNKISPPVRMNAGYPLQVLN
jgi:hypothetical protein